MRFTGPKAKRCRKYGSNIFGSAKYDKAIAERQMPARGAKRPPKKSEYGQQLLEKQKARDIYLLSEKQFARLYAEAAKAVGNTGGVLKQLLERRLDNVIYRAGLTMTRFQSRQAVSHGHFYVDGKRVTIPSFRVEPGQVITLRPQLKSSPLYPAILAAHEKYLPPKWMKVDGGAMRVEITALPESEDAEQALDVRQIVEFYSRN
jgi:small subunit ribosomal protein S4